MAKNNKIGLTHVAKQVGYGAKFIRAKSAQMKKRVKDVAKMQFKFSSGRGR